MIMISCSLQVMSDILLKHFNHILHCEIFPRSWAKGYINPLFKKGDCLDPGNYRGITVSSCLGKLFTRIMNERFMKFLEVNNIIKVNQTGFCPGKRTTDHLFVLKTLLDQAKFNKQHLYLCFVDLKYAFDTVWRDGLIYKLTKLHVSKMFTNLISNMYSKVLSRVKTKAGFTEAFPILVGTRQGCNLSPSLFNCYLNDLPNMLDKLNANQVYLLEKKISCLMYADDLVLISKTPGGLQKLILGTETFCNKWQLTINTNKTKIMVVHKRNTSSLSWNIYGKGIEIVRSFCYLGIELNTAGSFSNAIDRLQSKASRAYLSLSQKFNFHNGKSINVKHF